MSMSLDWGRKTVRGDARRGLEVTVPLSRPPSARWTEILLLLHQDRWVANDDDTWPHDVWIFGDKLRTDGVVEGAGEFARRYLDTLVADADEKLRTDPGWVRRRHAQESEQALRNVLTELGG